jgi:hypothetical protein
MTQSSEEQLGALPKYYGYISPSLREVNSQAQSVTVWFSRSTEWVTRESGFDSQQSR